MTDSNHVTTKKRGRPRTGQIPVVSFRLEPEWRQEIDEWRSGEPGHLSRSDAVRMTLRKCMASLSPRNTKKRGPIPVRRNRVIRKERGAIRDPEGIPPKEIFS